MLTASLHDGDELISDPRTSTLLYLLLDVGFEACGYGAMHAMQTASVHGSVESCLVT